MNESKPLVITRVFDAPVEKVWAAWTEPEQIMKWWGPKNFTSPHAEIDLRVGGKYLLCMHGQPGPNMPAMDMWNTGTFEEVVPNQRLVYLDSFSNEKGEIVSPAEFGMADFPQYMRVQLEFESLPDGKTKLTVSSDGAPAGNNYDNMEMGWNQMLDKLTEWVR